MLHSCYPAQIQNTQQIKQILAFSDDESSDEMSETGTSKISEYKLEIHQLDCQQGDSALVLFKKLKQQSYITEKSILIDGGPNGFKIELKNYITKIKITKLDAIIATHLDSDHIDGLPANDVIPHQNIFRPKTVHSTNNEQFKGLFPNAQPPEIGSDAYNWQYETKDERYEYYKVEKYNDENNRYDDLLSKIRGLEKPNLIFLTHDKQYLMKNKKTRGQWKQVKSSYERRELENNEVSIGMVIGFNNFYYETTGDCIKRKQNFITNLLSNKFQLKMSGRKSDHHLSYNEDYYLEDQDKILGTSFVINSFGYKNKYKHPDQDALDSLVGQPLSFIYNTNFSSYNKKFPHNTIIAGSRTSKFDGHIIITTTTKKSKNNKFDIRFISKISKKYDLYKDKYAKFTKIDQSLEYIKNYFKLKLAKLDLDKISFTEKTESIKQFPDKSKIIKYTDNPENTHLFQYCKIDCFYKNNLQLRYNYYLNTKNSDVITRIITYKVPYDNSNILDLNKNNPEIDSYSITFFRGKANEQSRLYEDLNNIKRKLDEELKEMNIALLKNNLDIIKKYSLNFQSLRCVYLNSYTDIKLLEDLYSTNNETILKNSIFINYYLKDF